MAPRGKSFWSTEYTGFSQRARNCFQLNTAIGGDADSIYLIVADIGSNSGEGLDFIDGFTFLERFYNVWDVANAQVGFATTSFTTATTN